MDSETIFAVTFSFARVFMIPFAFMLIMHISRQLID